ncbi:MAG: hypothetical protein CL843_03730 [Crocinitomicaceae bacterium]|nr:hypothetical protein [Crocinitomicaceae bacterium]|tara:strand:+ start:478 stop:921 length:444 start_codon:yes stop_codon:yes gene_type:complete
MKKWIFLFLFPIGVISCTPVEQVDVILSKHSNDSSKVVRQFEVSDSDDSIPVFEIEYYNNGQVKMEGSLNAKGNREGIWKAYYPDGKLWSDGAFKDGKSHGKRTVYFENGQIQSLGEYTNGKQSGVWQFWDKNGKLLDEKKYNGSNH